MDETYRVIRSFLRSCNEEDIMDSEAIIWIDLKEYDEDVVDYFNEQIDNEIKVTTIDNGCSYGDDIVLEFEDKKIQIPYEDDKRNMDTTIVYVNEIVQPKYEIRWFMESLGSDTLGFVILDSQYWDFLRKEFGHRLLNHYFQEIDLSTKMFELSIEEVDNLLKQRDSFSND